MPAIRKVRAGEPITDTLFNSLVDELIRLQNMTAAYPLGLIKGQTGYHFYSVPNGSGGTLTHIHFTTTAAFAANEATATVERVWGGTDTTVSATVTIRAEGGILDGVATGFTGTAVYDSGISKFRYLTDRWVAIEDGNKPGLLKDQWTGYNASATYTTGDDWDIEFERVGSAPNKTLRAYSKPSRYPGYNSGAIQVFGKDTANDITIISPAGHSPWIAINYAAATLTWTHAGPNSGETTTLLNTVIDKPSGAEDNTTFNFVSSANAGAINVLTAHYQSTANDDVVFFVRKIQFDSLGHCNLLDEETDGGSIQIEPNTDEFVKVATGTTAGRWEDIHTQWYATPTFELNNDPQVYSEQNGNELLLFEDWSTVTNYNVSAVQLHGHLSDASEVMIDVIGDTWISVTEDAPNSELELSHNDPPTGESTTAFGSSGETEAADTGTYSIPTTGAVLYTRLTRIAYGHAGDEKLYAYYRTERYDSKGHFVSATAETRVEVDAPEDC